MRSIPSAVLVGTLVAQTGGSTTPGFASPGAAQAGDDQNTIVSVQQRVYGTLQGGYVDSCNGHLYSDNANNARDILSKKTVCTPNGQFNYLTGDRKEELAIASTYGNSFILIPCSVYNELTRVLFSALDSMTRCFQGRGLPDKNDDCTCDNPPNGPLLL